MPTTPRLHCSPPCIVLCHACDHVRTDVAAFSVLLRTANLQSPTNSALREPCLARTASMLSRRRYTFPRVSLFSSSITHACLRQILTHACTHARLTMTLSYGLRGGGTTSAACLSAGRTPHHTDSASSAFLFPKAVGDGGSSPLTTSAMLGGCRVRKNKYVFGRTKELSGRLKGLGLGVRLERPTRIARAASDGSADGRAAKSIPPKAIMVFLLVRDCSAPIGRGRWII